MTRFAAAGVFGAVALAGLAFADEKALKDLDGTYKVVAAEKDGKPIPAEDRDKVLLTFKGDRLTVASDGAEKAAEIKIDASKDPATIDITPADGPEKSRTFPGLIKAEKGEVTLVFTEKQGAGRPKAFTSEGGATLLRLKRDDKKDEKKVEKK
jgi:uncharacterized protein (TIGR03067 family)